MNEQHADQGHRKLFQTMAGMTWPERIKYFLYYYGKLMLAVILVLAIIGDFFWKSLQEKPEVLYAGLAINVQVSQELEDVLTTDLMAHLGVTDSTKQEVTLSPARFSDFDLQAISTYKTKLSIGTYDYAILDMVALAQLAPSDVFPDLNLLLPKEKLEPFADWFMYGMGEDGELVPIAIKIADTPLGEECTYSGENLFLVFPAIQETAHKIPVLFDYIVENLLNEAD